ncbi:hypothetical protein [Xanthomonas tesorieronis]|uniref:hypothetical protein n=1 Tax=Xanthomonas tesorieronis TaxID=3160839 RepID=UPI003517B91E
MTLSIAGRLLRSPRTLTEPAQLTLARIDGGTQWFEWASGSAQRYDFADERSLLDGVQQGLHGTSMLWLPRIGLQVGPAKLLTLALHELALIHNAESIGDSEALAHRVQDLLAAHDLVTNAELASADAFLTELGVATAPLLQVLDFDGRMAVWRLAAADPQPAARAVSRREAADFALARAQSALEFCDYYRYYLQSAADGRNAAARRQATNEALDALLPALFDALGGPRFEGAPAPNEMQLAINSYLATGRAIGFPRLSLAAQQIAGQIAGPGGNPDRLRRSVGSVLQAAQVLLGSGSLRPGRLGQDGASLQFLAQDGDRRVLLQFAGDVLTIAELAVATDAVAAEAPPPAPPRRPQAIPAPAAPPVLEASANAEERLKQAQQQMDEALRTAERLIAEAEAVAAAAIRQANEAADAAQAAANAAISRSSRT